MLFFLSELAKVSLQCHGETCVCPSGERSESLVGSKMVPVKRKKRRGIGGKERGREAKDHSSSSFPFLLSTVSSPFHLSRKKGKSGEAPTSPPWQFMNPKEDREGGGGGEKMEVEHRKIDFE